jgi:hypothetical protein
MLDKYHQDGNTKDGLRSRAGTYLKQAIQRELAPKHEINTVPPIFGINGTKHVVSSAVEFVAYLVGFPATSLCVTLRKNTFAILAGHPLSAFVAL